MTPAASAATQAARVPLTGLLVDAGMMAADRHGLTAVAQGDWPGAAAAYEAALTIREGLAMRDPANTQRQMDVAVSCANLGSLDSLLSIQERQEYLSRGLKLLTSLKQSGRLHANQDSTGWFDNALSSLI